MVSYAGSSFASSLQIISNEQSSSCYVPRRNCFFILSVRSDYHMTDILSIAVHAFVSRVSMSFSFTETLLPASSVGELVN